MWAAGSLASQSSCYTVLMSKPMFSWYLRPCQVEQVAVPESKWSDSSNGITVFNLYETTSCFCVFVNTVSRLHSNEFFEYQCIAHYYLKGSLLVHARTHTHTHIRQKHIFSSHTHVDLPVTHIGDQAGPARGSGRVLVSSSPTAVVHTHICTQEIRNSSLRVGC